MLDDKSLLELCLSVSGKYEGGSGNSYDTLAGNFDGMGLSAGILQWNAGQGTLQILVQNIGAEMGWDKAQTFFHSDIHHFAVLKPQDAIQWCLDHYIANGSTHVDPAAAAAWKNFLGQPESIDAQVKMATNGVLSRAKVLVQQFTPTAVDGTRAYAFFFDLVTQSGGMHNQRGHVDPTTTPDYNAALAFAQTKSATCYSIWSAACQSDTLAQLLIHYAYQRALLSNPAYIWDAYDRRATIACRGGYVHGARLDLTDVLD